MKLFKGITLKKTIVTLSLLLCGSLHAQSYNTLKKEAYDLYHSGAKKEAILHVDKYVKSHPKSYKGQNLLAVLHYWSGDMKEAKEILEGIVSKREFPEAKKLLKSVNAKLGTQKSYKALRKNNAKTDLEYLVSQVDKNPQDIHNRVLLSKFYFKIEQYQKAYDMAYEALKIDPHNAKMKKIEGLLSSQYKMSYSGKLKDSILDKEKAHALLKELHQKRDYRAYVDLYKALKASHAIFSQEEYLDALHASIMIKEYQEAKEILSKGVLPVDKNTLKVQLLLENKLAS
jgi:tetratricopeptide (TPR) repeat protein